MQTVTVEELAKAKGFTVEQLERFHVRDELFGEGVEIPYLDARGTEFPRVRVRYGDRKFAWTPGKAPLQLYGLWRPVAWGDSLVVVEGESDCWALWANLIPAIGVPGASNFSLLNGALFKGVKYIGVAQEPGEAGSAFPFNCAQQLYASGFMGEVSAVRFTPYKDAREAYLDNPEMVCHFFESAPWKQRSRIQRAAPRHGPRITTYAELLDQPPEVHHWRIDGLVHDDGVALLSSLPKIGKSTLLRNLALAIVRGEKFLDRATAQTPVVWVALEESKSHVLESFRKLGLTRDDAIAFHFGDPPTHTFDWIREVSEGYGAIIIDTLGKFFPRIQRFEDYAEMNRTMRDAERFARETHRTLFFAHHSPWSDQTRGLGSTALAGATDANLVLKGYSTNRAILSSAQRGGTPFDRVIVVYDRATDRVSLGESRHEATIETFEARILALFEHGEPLTREQILRVVSGNMAAKSEALGVMLRSGALVVVGGAGTKGNPLHYLPRSKAGDRTSVVLAFPSSHSDSPVAQTSTEPDGGERNRNGTTMERALLLVGGVHDNLRSCAVCGNDAPGYDLADGRRWCTACYDRGDRPEST